jgi:hypothetical protein
MRRVNFRVPDGIFILKLMGIGIQRGDLTRMLQLQTKFMEEFLIQFLSGADKPLAKLKNPKPQNDEIPKELNLIKIDPASSGPDESKLKPRF